MKTPAVVGLAIGLGAYALGIFYGYKYGVEVGKIKMGLELNNEIKDMTKKWEEDLNKQTQEELDELLN